MLTIWNICKEPIVLRQILLLYFNMSSTTTIKFSLIVAVGVLEDKIGSAVRHRLNGGLDVPRNRRRYRRRIWNEKKEESL
jgi:hypothetical protein